MTRIWIALPLLLLLPLGVSAQSFWDGDAAIQRGDAVFESGNYAASNSFAEGTQVVVQDLDTGRNVTVTVRSRIPGQSNVLMMLSPTAAQNLGMRSGSIARVRVTLSTRPDTVGSGIGEQTLSTDPDINPAAAYEPPVQTQPVASSQPPAQTAQAAQPASEAPTGGPQQSQQTQTAAATTVEAPAPQAESPDQQIIAEAESRSPQKELYLPPREDQRFALQPGAQTAEATAPGEQAEIASVTPEGGAPSQESVPPGTTQEPGQPEIASVSPEAAAPPAGTQTGPSSATAQPEVQATGQPEVASVSSQPPAAPAPASEGTEQLAEASLPAQTTAAPVEVEGAPAQPTQGQAASGELAAPPLEEAAVPASPVQTEVSSPTAVPPAESEEQRLALLAPEAPQPAARPAEPTPAAAGAPAASTPAAAGAPAASTPTSSTAAPVARPSATARPATVTAVARTADRYFLQLAAFGSEKPAQDLAAKLSPTYPTVVVAPSTPGSSVFRVLVGPLNRAESGTVLLWFRDRGYRDAFLRQE